MRGRILFVIPITLCTALLAGGCVQRQLTVKSTPPGALLYLNGVEVGRTPVTRDFVWYGAYQVELRHVGYETLKTRGDVNPPWWQWVPIDFFAEFLPLRDHQHLEFAMRPQAPHAGDSAGLLQRGEALGSELESSERTRFRVTTRPATHPTTRRAATTPATQPATTTTTAPEAK